MSILQERSAHAIRMDNSGKDGSRCSDGASSLALQDMAANGPGIACMNQGTLGRVTMRSSPRFGIGRYKTDCTLATVYSRCGSCHDL